MLPDRYKGSVVSFRNDRMGARFLSIMNAIRIAQDYDLPYFFTWMTHGRASEELLAPTEIFAKNYFDDHFVSHEDFRLINANASDLAMLPTSAKADIITDASRNGNAFLCMGTELVVLSWEQADDVAPRYAKAIDHVVFDDRIVAAMKAVDEALTGSGTAFHVRRGDIIHDPVTSNQLWSNKYIPREFYETLAERLTADATHKVLVFSDEPAEIRRLKQVSQQIIAPDEVLPKDLTRAQRDFMEIYAMSRCQQIIGPPGSGFSAAAALIGNRPIHDVRDVLTAEENAAALELLFSRLEERSEIFLSVGDIGQSLPFACQHLNATGRSKDALTLLEGYRSEGFSKLFFFKMLLEQQLQNGCFDRYDAVLDNLRTATLDPAIPARLEQHWSETSRIASILAAKSGNIARVQHHVAMAFWYCGGNRPAFGTLSQLFARGQIDPLTFPLPFDPAVKRPVPASLGPRPGTEDLLLEDSDLKSQWILPPDIMVRDWQYFMGKTLARGFDKEATIISMLAAFNQQFARHCPDGSRHSVLGVYAHALGKLEDAMAHHQAALLDDAENPLFLKRMATTMLAINANDVAARVLLEKAAEIAAAQGVYRAELARCLFEQDARSQAIQIMRKLCSTADVLPEIPFLAARMMRQDRQITDETLAFTDQALAIAPHVRRFMVMRVQVLSDLQRWAEAMATLDKITARFGDGGDIKALRTRIKA